MQLRSVELAKGDKKSATAATVKAVYDMPTVKAVLTLTYTIAVDGQMNVVQAMTTTAGEKVSDMFRFADEQFYPYIRPQENGTRSDIRWWKQTYSDGTGFTLTAQGAFSASALHYTIDDLNDGDAKTQRHSPEVPKSKYTNLCIDLVQTGVGGVDSWSQNAIALPKYRVPYKDYTFSFTITPDK